MKNIIIILILSLFYACQQENGTMCTEEFRSITISVTDSLNNPIVLDDYYTQNISTKEIIRWQDKDPFWDSISVANGNYLLVSDLEMNWTNSHNVSVKFFGFLDSVKVIEEVYTISDNLCHIYLVNGKEKIILK